QLADHMPHRYVHNGDGTWSCPPGEGLFGPLMIFTTLVMMSPELVRVCPHQLYLFDQLREVSPKPLQFLVVYSLTLYFSCTGQIGHSWQQKPNIGTRIRASGATWPAQNISPHSRTGSW